MIFNKVFIMFLPLLCAACGPGYPGICKSTCEAISLCEIERPGLTLEEQHKVCLEECSVAARGRGEFGNYEQVKDWSECVSQTGCSDLEQNYCEPIW